MIVTLRSLRSRLVPGGCALVIAAGLLTGAPTAQAQDGKAVLDLLVREGLLTAEQAAKVGKEASKAPEPAAKPAPVFVTPGGKAAKLTLGGFIQAHFEMGGTPDVRYAGMNDRFLLRRARLNVNATFAEYFQAKLEGEFGAGTINSATSTRGQLTDGFVQWNRYPEVTFRMGQFKTPFGYEQLYSDTKVFTIERGLVSDRLTVSRQLGGMLTGDVLDKKLTYSVGAFNGSSINTSLNDNNDFMLVGRLNGVLLSGGADGKKFTWTGGINGFSTDDSGAFTGTRTGFGLDTQLVIGPGTFQAEWLENERDPTTGATINTRGWSVLGAWAFDKHWRGVVRFDSIDTDTAALNATTEEWILGLDYLIKGDDLRLSINYVIGDQPAPLDRDDRFIARLQAIF